MSGLNVGDRVILLKVEARPSPKIPLWGSSHMCAGIIRSLTNEGEGHETANVRWDNGRISVFFTYKLGIYKDKAETDPNMAFLLKKRGNAGG